MTQERTLQALLAGASGALIFFILGLIVHVLTDLRREDHELERRLYDLEQLQKDDQRRDRENGLFLM